MLGSSQSDASQVHSLPLSYRIASSACRTGCDVCAAHGRWSHGNRSPQGACAISRAAFQNAERQAIVIDPDGNVVYVCCERLSDSGWNV